MTRHADPRTTGSRLPSTRFATAAGWALLAAVGVGGLATTTPVAPGSPGSGPGQSRTEQATADGALFVGPTTQEVITAAAPAVVAPAVTLTAAPAPLAFRVSTYATGDPDTRAAVAVRAATAQIGLPYVWGGDGPMNGDAGFDCSGLTHFAYEAAGIALPRTAHTQFYAGPRVPSGAPLQPGDLVFYGTLSRVHHVGMYIGDGRMVNAPTFGRPVQTAYYRWPGDDYVGATRPAATATGDSSALPFIPETAPPPAPAQPGESDVFVAPPAPLPSTLPASGATQVPEAQSAAEALTEQQQTGATPLAPTTTPAPTATPTTEPTTLVAAPPVTTDPPSNESTGAGDGSTAPTGPSGPTAPTGPTAPLAPGPATALAPPPAVNLPAVTPPVSSTLPPTGQNTLAGASPQAASDGTPPAGSTPAPAGSPSLARPPSTAPVPTAVPPKPAPSTTTTKPPKPVPAQTGPPVVTTPEPTTPAPAPAATSPSANPSANPSVKPSAKPSAKPTTPTPVESGTGTPAQAVPVASVAPKPSPAPRSTVTIGGTATPVAKTALGATGLPLRAGVVARPGRPVVRLVAAPSAAVGSTVTLRLGTGAPVTYTVASSTVLTAAEAAALITGAPAGELVVVAPAAGGGWTVLTAT